MKNSLKKILYGAKKAYSILPSTKDKMMVFSLWVLSLISYFVSMIMPTLQKYITDGAASLIDSSPQYSLLIIGFCGLIINMLLGFYTRKKLFVWSSNVSALIANSITGELIKKSSKIKYKYFDDNTTYDKLLNVSSNVPQKISEILTWSTIPPIFGGLISLIFTTIILSTVSWVIAILIAIGNILSIFFYYKRMKDNYFLQINQIPERRWAGAYWSPLVGRDCLKEVKLFGLSQYLVDKWKKYSLKTSKTNFKFSLKYSTILLLTDTVSLLFKTVALLLVAYLILAKKTSIGSFMLVYGSIDVFRGYLSDISRAFINLSENSRYIDNWIEFMNLEEEDTSEAEDIDKLDISFKNVKFRYPNTDFDVINGIDLEIKEGEHLAIVGENGSGKSTFVSLINGFYDNFEGEILVNGKSLKDSVPILRKYIANVYQDYGCYEFTVKENINIGNLYSENSDEDILNAAKATGAYDFIKKLPKDMDTEIGTYKEDGINLSGGQWQKIAISRALLRKHAKLTILDEPTAALDPYAESVIYKEFADKTKNQTSILISHRLGATIFADRILVFDKGKIVEDGTHEELMSKRGLYYNMYTAQSKWYT